MRIIGSIPHPYLKISVFQNDGRYSIKFENGLLEQIYKFRDGEGVDSLESAQRWVDQALLDEVVAHFGPMLQSRLQAVNRILPKQEDIFEEII